LLNDHEVRYLIIGGYAVGYHGYVRATADMDIWIERSDSNAKRLVKVFKEFGFDVDELNAEIFLEKEQVIRMGVPPIRIEVLTSISGIEFKESYETRVKESWEGVSINIISLENLKRNKRASGRLKDLNDLEHLE